MTQRPSVIVFDVIETLFPLEPIRAKLQGVGLPGAALEVWFAQLLRNAFALNATDSYRPFKEVALDALSAVASANGATLTEQQRAEIIGTFAQLDAYSDVAPGMQRLAEREVRMVALTNGSQEVTSKLLACAGVDELIELVISVDEVRLWKPRQEVYLHCAQRCGVEPSAMTLVACHGWDIHGAKNAGLGTAFLRRHGKTLSTIMGTPDHDAEHLNTLIDELLDGG
ncbi:MAG: haloacid dehalogenase type II [Pseudomonas sp.]|nr:haloacid dehalogenase type II [Pseudomonas sp.]